MILVHKIINRIGLWMTLFSLLLPASAFADPDSSEESVISSETKNGSSYEESTEASEPVLEGSEAVEESTNSGNVLSKAEESIKASFEGTLTDNGQDLNGQVGTGTVVFAAELPPGVHDTVYISVMNGYSYKTYTFRIYEVNGFTDFEMLPEGTYTVTDAGLVSDTEDKYYAPVSSFTVNAGERTVVPMVFSLKEEFSENVSEDVVTEYADETENESIEETADGATAAPARTMEEIRKDSMKGIARGVLFTGILIIGVVIFLNKRYGGKKRGFDD